jgi:DNA repair photolyase
LQKPEPVIISHSDFNDRDKTFMEQFEIENREELQRLQQEHAERHQQNQMFTRVQSEGKFATIGTQKYKTPVTQIKGKQLAPDRDYYKTTDESLDMDDKVSIAASVAKSRRDKLDRLRPKSSRQQKRLDQMNENQAKLQKQDLE